MSNIAIRYRAYPNDEQKEKFNNTFGCVRLVYNLMLEERIENHKTSGKFEGHTPAYFKKMNKYSFLQNVDSLSLCNAQLNLNKAFSNCFDKKRKKRNNFPKFKSKKHSRKSYTTNNGRGTIAINVETCEIKLPKTGWVKVKLHRLPDESWALKSATISMDPDESYYISVLFEYEDVMNNYIPDIENAIGLDYSSPNLYVDSNGDIGTNHKYFKESARKLAKAQRRLSKKVGNRKNEIKSKNYLKQSKKVNKIHRKITNQRKDNLHKISTVITKQYDVVCVEDINMVSLSNKGFGNGKSTLDNGYGMFLNLLEYKLERNNKHFVKIDKWYPSSQICHCCGYRNKEVKRLAIRKWECPDCHTLLDRDHNAAINIKVEGMRILKQRLGLAA